MRLAEFIETNVDAILVEWVSFARSLPPGFSMDVEALRDHAEAILVTTARDIVSSQTQQQQASKSKGHGGGGSESVRLDHASETHAIERLGAGFDLLEVVSEYRALRASVLHLWSRTARTADAQDLEDVTRFNESMDQSLAEAVRSFTSRVEESRELFLATLGHDLRAPLNAIMLSAQVLSRSGQLDEENAAVAARMPGFVNTMTTMIHDLLDFTRSRLGKGIPLSPATIDLTVLCTQVLDEFRIAHPERALRFASEGDLRGEWDGARLRQVLSNLIANALEHGDPIGPIEVTATDAGADVVLSVRNQGPVIPASVVPTLFDPFVRGAAMPRSGGHRTGVGLGLFISREIVTSHGGLIAVDSSDATGTMFTVRLPKKNSRAGDGRRPKVTNP